MINNPFANAEDLGDADLILGLGRSLGEGNGSPLQYSRLEDSITEELGGLQSMGRKELDVNE